MPEGRVIKIIDVQETKFLCLLGLTCVQIVFIRPGVTVSLCRFASALHPFGMAYVTLFHVLKQNISDYANMLTRCSGLMH